MTESKDILRQGDLILRSGLLVSDWFAFNYTGNFFLIKFQNYPPWPYFTTRTQT